MTVDKYRDQASVIVDLIYSDGYRGKVVKIIPDLEKEIRAEQATAELETGKFLLPAQSSWLDEFVRECRPFPAGRHDNQVASLVQFVNWQKMPRGRAMANRNPMANLASRRPTFKERIQDRYKNQDW